MPIPYDPIAFLQEQDRQETPLTPNDLNLRYQAQQQVNEQNRREKMNEKPTDPLSAALGMNFSANGKNGSYFPGAKLYADNSRNDLNDMLNQSPETGFLAKPGSTPAPTPTPTPKPSAMNLAQLYQHFGVESRPPMTVTAQPNMPPPDQLEAMRAQYGWNNG